MKEKTYNIGEYDTWEFIEDNLPNYHQRDDVLHNDLVSRFVNCEDMEEADYKMVHEEFEGNILAAEDWLDKDIKRLFLEAVEAAYDNQSLRKIETFEK